jgi:SAM-dependent methyltransferase
VELGYIENRWWQRTIHAALPLPRKPSLSMTLRQCYYKLSPSQRLWARKVVYFPIDLYEKVFKRRSVSIPPKGDIYIGSGDFVAVGSKQVHQLREHIGLQTSDAVLDIGSGIGRTAIPLTTYLDQDGRYEGFDVVEKGVIWCKQNISAKHPRFGFNYVPLHNDLYNTSAGKASEFRFPYLDDSFDKAFLFSVFTHMGVAEIAHYLAEIDRVLKPGGECLATFFLYNDENEASITSREDFNFPFARDGYRLMDATVESANIAISESSLERMLVGTKLRVDRIVEGHWKNDVAKNPNNDFQDMVVLKR